MPEPLKDAAIFEERYTELFFPYDRVKSACEFYLRYKDNPKLLGKEHPLLIEKVNELYRKHIEIEEELGENYDPKSKTFIDEYNEWLFKYSFFDIFAEKESGLVKKKSTEKKSFVEEHYDPELKEYPIYDEDDVLFNLFPITFLKNKKERN